jgi:renalase
MHSLIKRRNVAVVGAGMAGAACAHALLQAGHRVHVFDKSRGPGGRMATRRMPWVDAVGAEHVDHFDHGVWGFAANGPAFGQFVRSAELAGHLRSWRPAVDPAGWRLDGHPLRYVPVPQMPQWCQHLLLGADLHWYHEVQRLHAGPMGWQLTLDEQLQPACFDSVVLALPPAQAAVLLADHRREWAQRASLALMQPCWTLMGVATEPGLSTPLWQVARPTRGPLALLLRADASPGRQPVQHQTTWVAHARPAWSREHLEHPAAWVQAQLKLAVADWLARPVAWQSTAVHRWRYAMTRAVPTPQSSQCWWNDKLRLGVCGDFLGGQGANGVEGAWLSGTDLARAFLASETKFSASKKRPSNEQRHAPRRAPAKSAMVS